MGNIIKLGKESYTSGEFSLSDSESDKLFSVIEKLEDLCLFEVVIAGGMRRDDLVRIKWDGVDFVNKKINFIEKKKKNRSKIVYVSDTIIQHLKMLYNKTENKIYVFDGRSDSKYGKGHLASRSAYNKFQEYLVKAGLQTPKDRRPFHSLRATCIKLCKKKGWTVEQTSKHVGDSIRVIQRHYETPTDTEMQEVANNKPLI